MDLNDLRSILRKSGVDVWSLIDSAISLASSADYRDELKIRRDGIVEKLYAPPPLPPVITIDNNESPPSNDEINNKLLLKDRSSHDKRRGGGRGERVSPPTPQSIDAVDDDDDDEEDYHHQDRRNFDPPSIDEEQTKILTIKEHLEDPHQSEDSLVNLLQSLADMDITFKALKETDIGRHVNRLRKNPSSDVRKLVKQLVRNWKDLVDEWVKANASGGAAASAIIDGDSPQQNPSRNYQNIHHQVPDFAYSPNPHNGSSGSDKYNSESEPRMKVTPRRDTPAKPSFQSVAASSSAPPSKQREQRDSKLDAERLASARRRLQENYQEAQNAKKQRTIQVMDLHDIPKPKNSYFAKNKGSSQSKHW